MTHLSEPYAYLMDLTSHRSTLRLPVRETRFTIGRAADNHLCLVNDTNVSRHHCALVQEMNSLRLEDTASRNGVYLEGQRLAGAATLTLPTWFQVGQTRLAVLPTLLEEAQLVALRSATYCSPDSILIPATDLFEKRTNAFLVVDVVRSSKLMETKGSAYLAKVAMVLGQRLERALRTEAQPFLKCTGDGFFACFGSAETALAAAQTLASAVQRHIPDPPPISVGLHWGEAYLASDLDRIGQDAHAAFSVENVRAQDAAWGAAIANGDVAAPITLTAVFRAQLPEAQQAQTVSLGLFKLKGLAEKQEIFRWIA